MKTAKTYVWLKLHWVTLVCVLASPLCHAVDKTWTGSASIDWFDGNNWNPVGVPGTNDTAIINSGFVYFSSTNETIIARLTLNGGAMAPNIKVTTNFTWIGGSLQWGGTITIAASATLIISGDNDKTFIGCTLNNSGTATWSGSGRIVSLDGTIYGAPNNIINNLSGGTFEAQSTAVIRRDYFSAPSLIFNNAGTFRKTGTGTTNTFPYVTANWDSLFNNSGTVEVLSGTLNVGNFNNAGTVRVQGGSLELGSGNSSGVFDVQPAGTLNFIYGFYAHELNGATFTNLGSVIFSGGTVGFGADTTIPGAVTLSSGSIWGTNEVTFQTLTWTGGTLGGGVTTIAPGGTLAVSGSNDKTLGCTLNNHGAATWTGSGTFYSDGATFYNATNGTFDVRTDSTYTRISPSVYSSFINLGTFRKSAGTGTDTFFESFLNGGLLQIQTGGLDITELINVGTAQVQNGILRVSYDSDSTGRFMVSAGAALEFDGNSHVLETNSLISGAGELHLIGGGIDLDGTNLITGAIRVQGTWDRGVDAEFNRAQSFGSSNAPLFITGGGAYINANVSLASVTLSGGTLGGTGLTITNGGLLTWTGGALGGGGVTTIAPGGTLTISGSNDKVFVGHTLNNNGIAKWSGSGRIVNAGGFGSPPSTINNLSGATFETQSSTSIQKTVGNTPTFVFNNAGTFRKTGAGTTTKFDYTFYDTLFTNSGIIEVRSGKLVIENCALLNQGTVLFPIGGRTAGVDFGQFQDGRSSDGFQAEIPAPLDGTFRVILTNSFRPTGCDTFELMKFSSKTGNFANTNGLNLGGGLSFIMNFSSTDLTLITAAPQPCLGSVVSLTNGQFQFQITGQVGSNYMIQASTNFSSWIPIATNVIPVSGVLSVTDPSATNYSRRFYRAMAQ